MANRPNLRAAMLLFAAALLTACVTTTKTAAHEEGAGEFNEAVIGIDSLRGHID